MVTVAVAAKVKGQSSDWSRDILLRLIGRLRLKPALAPWPNDAYLLRAQRHAPELALAVNDAALPLVLAVVFTYAPRLLGLDVDREHARPVLGDAIDDAVPALEAVLPLVLDAVEIPPDDLALHRRRHDLEHAVGVAGDAIDVPIRADDAAEVPVGEVAPKLHGVVEGAAEGRHLAGVHVDLEHRADVIGQAVDVAVGVHDAAVPLPAPLGEVPEERHLVRPRVDLDDAPGVLRDAVDAAVAAEQAAVPLLLPRPRPAERRHLAAAAARVDLDHGLGGARDAVDAAVVRREHAAVPLPRAVEGPADGDRLLRRRRDLEHVRRAARQAVDAVVRREDAAQPLVLAGEGAAEGADLLGLRVDEKHLAGVAGDAVDAAVGAELAAEPLALAGKVHAEEVYAAGGGVLNLAPMFNGEPKLKPKPKPNLKPKPKPKRRPEPKPRPVRLPALIVLALRLAA
eukprot:CAMPEP_0118880956 /NCGR_PEP_ID=MMETSP1163-20130328/20485_1 /TAXON_ID=124430 /ORGANISM="Phaeomonas parva, Strain CCMP2877" /LENGTH=454 /DNA_ID=CAMNT_0006817571 /DNA_START=117 /DNA_END=1481 /DNA_ORIENTATION=-